VQRRILKYSPMIAVEQDEGAGWAYGGAAEAIFVFAPGQIVTRAPVCIHVGLERFGILDDLVTTDARHPDRQEHDQQSQTRRELAYSLH
jgi:hypothetical protein